MLFRGARHGHKMSAKQKRLEMQETELMAKMKKTYRLEHKSTDQNTMPLNTKTPDNNDEIKVDGKKTKKKKHKKCENHKDKNIIANSRQSNNSTEDAVVFAEPTQCKDNVDYLQGKKIKKHKSKKGSGMEVLKADGFVSKPISDSKKKRKAKDGNDYESICDKKLSKEM